MGFRRASRLRCRRNAVLVGGIRGPALAGGNYIREYHADCPRTAEAERRKTTFYFGHSAAKICAHIMFIPAFHARPACMIIAIMTFVATRSNDPANWTIDQRRGIEASRKHVSRLPYARDTVCARVTKVTRERTRRAVIALSERNFRDSDDTAKLLYNGERASGKAASKVHRS